MTEQHSAQCYAGTDRNGYIHRAVPVLHSA